MTQEKWLDLLVMIKDKFELESDTKEPSESGPGEKQTLIFSTGQGKFKLERLVRPRVLDKKTSFSHRSGGEVKVDYVYSQDETVDKLTAYRWNDASSQWIEIQPDAFNL